MFFHILKKDLKRQRTMNIILLVFIILATLFLASSVDNLILVNGAIDYFLEISKVPDFFNLALTDGVTDRDYASGIFCLQVQAENAESEEVREKLEAAFPEYKVLDMEGFLDDMIGGVIEQIDTLMVFIMGVVLVINSLITILMMKTIMTKEHGNIALLKSIGFSDGSLRAWQTLRILLVLAAAVVAGTVLSNLLAPFIIGPIFAMMGGTSMKFVMNTFEAFVSYPALLLGVTGISAAFCAGGVKKVETREVNTGE